MTTLHFARLRNIWSSVLAGSAVALLVLAGAGALAQETPFDAPAIDTIGEAQDQPRFVGVEEVRVVVEQAPIAQCRGDKQDHGQPHGLRRTPCALGSFGGLIWFCLHERGPFDGRVTPASF